MIIRVRFFIVLLCSWNIVLLSANDIDLNKTIPLDILQYNNVSYISLNEFIVTHGLRSNYYEAKDKLEIIYNRNKMYFSPGITYCKINSLTYNLIYPTLHKKNTFYVPIQSFYQSLKLAGLPFRIIKEIQDLLYVIKMYL